MSGLEIGLLVLVALALVAVYVTMKIVKPLIINAIVGLLIIFAVDFLGFVEVELGLLAVAIVAIGGVPGAVLVLLLAYLGVAFAPAAALAALA